MMNGLVIVVSVLVAAGCCRDRPLDKTGTTGSQNWAACAKSLEKKELADAGSFLAEREGFEATRDGLMLRCPHLAPTSKEPENPSFRENPGFTCIVLAHDLSGHCCPQIAPKLFAPALLAEL